MKLPYIYILTNKPKGTLYVGSTTNLVQRIWHHKNGFVDSFSKKYSLSQLVYFEQCADIEHMASRERRLKHWNRQWKVDFIEQKNPCWLDLYDEITQ